MTENTNKPQAPKRKSRRWLKIIGVLFILLILLVLFAPMIASTSPVRNFVVGKINDNLNGHAQVADWSIGWTGGISADGIKLYDTNNVLILEIPKFRTGLTLINAIRGDYDLGETAADVNLVRAEIDEQGNLNYQKLVKTQPAPATQSPPAKREKAAKPAQPNVKGHILLNLRGQVVGPTLPQPVTIQPSTIDLNIKSLQTPIDNVIKLVLQVGDGQPGTIHLAGSADINNYKSNQKLGIEGLDLNAANPFLKLAKAPVTLAGITNGSIDLRADNMNAVAAEGSIEIANFLLGGQALKNDRFSTKLLTIPLKLSRNVASGVTQLQIDTAVRFDQGSITVNAAGHEEQLLAALKAIPQIIQDSISGKKGTQQITFSDGDGQATVTADLDLAALARQLPNALAIPKDTSITAGQLKHRTSLVLSAGKGVITTTTDTTRLTGTSDGNAVALEPIHLDAGATVVSSPATDLRDIALKLNSAFATIDATAPSLFTPRAIVNADLNRLVEQISPFVKLNGMKLAGALKLTLNSQGDWTQPDTSIHTTANILGQALEITGIKGLPPVKQDRLATQLTADLHRGPTPAIDAVRNLLVQLQLGSEQAPTIDLNASADASLDAGQLSSAKFNLAKLNVNLPAIQRDFGAFIPALAQQKLDINAGQLALTGAGSYDGATVLLDKQNLLRLSATNLTLLRQGALVLQNIGLNVELAGSFKQAAKSFEAAISTLSLVDSNNWINLIKTGPNDLLVRYDSAASRYAANGKLGLSAHLKPLMDIAAAFSGSAPSPNQPGQLRTGQLTGNLDLSTPADQTRLAANLALRNLSVTTATQPLQNQNLDLSLVALAPQDFSTLTAEQLQITSPLLKLVSTAPLKLNLKGSTFEKLQSAALELTIPDLNALLAVAQAFQPPAPATAPQPSALPPLALGSGSLHVAFAAQRQGTTTSLTVADLSVKDLTLTRGISVVYKARPIALQLAAALDTAGSDITQLQISQLAGTLGLTDITLVSPIVITKPQQPDRLVNGALKLQGQLQPISALLDALRGTPSEQTYTGDYVITQKIVTQNDQLSLDGTGQVANLKLLDNSGNPLFTEQLLELANQLSLDNKTKSLAINNLRLNMRSSGALDLTATGGITDYEKARQFNNLKLVLGYDLEKLWPLVRPMLSKAQQDQYKDLTIAGKFQKTFTVTGAFPAGMPLEKSIKLLKADGGFAIAKLTLPGYDLANADLLFSVNNGLVTTGNAAPAQLNGGTLNLAGLTLDLTANPPRLSTLPNTALMKNVALNQQISLDFLKILGPLFSGASRVAGNVTVNVINCDRLPLNATLFDPARPTEGAMNLTLNVDNLQLGGNPLLDAALGGLTQGQIQNATVSITPGLVTQNIPITLGQQTIRSQGTINLADNGRLNVTTTIPASLFQASALGAIKAVRQVNLSQINVILPVKGTLSKIEFDLPKAIADSVGKSIIPGVLGNILGGNQNQNQNQNPPPSSQPQNQPQQQPPPSNPAEDLLKGLLNRRNKK